MLLILKALLLLVLELIIEYLLGTMLVKLVLKTAENPCLNLMMGFMAYQALFQVMSLTFTFTTRVLHHLTIAWGAILLVLVPLSFWVGKDIIKKHVLNCIKIVKCNKELFLLFVIVTAAFCYYTSINGERNDDAQYYVALMTTSVQTDSLFQYNVYTGQEMDSLYLRRALATFEIHSAVLSQMFQIHPILVARIFRACQNVILTSIAVLSCASALFWRKDAECIEKSLLTTVVFWALQMPFANTIYTPAAFLLYRTYEAKAFTANFVVFFGLYLCVKALREQNRKYLIFIAFYLWGSMALSTSAMVVAFTECGLLLVPVWLQRWILRRKREKRYAG